MLPFSSSSFFLSDDALCHGGISSLFFARAPVPPAPCCLFQCLPACSFLHGNSVDQTGSCSVWICMVNVLVILTALVCTVSDTKPSKQVKSS